MSAEFLASAVKARRTALNLRQPELAGRGGPNLGVTRNVEQAANDSYAATTLAALDRCLGWADGSAARALHHAEPPTVLPEDPQTVEDARAQRIGYAVLALMRELAAPADGDPA